MTREARIRQSNLVVAKLMAQAKIEYGIPVVDHPDPVAMPKDHVARVNTQPITRLQFGRQLVMRMPLDDVRDWLDRECKDRHHGRRGRGAAG